jgi:hypothetical protein
MEEGDREREGKKARGEPYASNALLEVVFSTVLLGHRVE